MSRDSPDTLPRRRKLSADSAADLIQPSHKIPCNPYVCTVLYNSTAPHNDNHQRLWFKSGGLRSAQAHTTRSSRSARARNLTRPKFTINAGFEINPWVASHPAPSYRHATAPVPPLTYQARGNEFHWRGCHTMRKRAARCTYSAASLVKTSSSSRLEEAPWSPVCTVRSSLLVAQS
ncbi:hypothetical protein L209DRAFT_753337 [Thermothelomyces heterothallicus CBS 203.75]